MPSPIIQSEILFIRYSELTKCPALVSTVDQIPSAANERPANKGWVRNMSIKDNPGTLPINLELNRAAYESAILSVRLERSKEKQQLPKRRWKGEKGHGISSSRLNTQQNEIVLTFINLLRQKKQRRCAHDDAALCNPSTCTEEAEREINVKEVCGSLTESFVNDEIIAGNG